MLSDEEFEEELRDLRQRFLSDEALERKRQELPASVSDEQLETIRSICDDPRFLSGAYEIITVSMPSPNDGTRDDVRRQLQQVVKALNNLSSKAADLMDDAHQRRAGPEDCSEPGAYVDLLKDAAQNALDDEIPRGNMRKRRLLGTGALALFRQHRLVVSHSNDGDFVLFLGTLIEAMGTRYDARTLARDTLARTAKT